ncbi:hypothetical protein vseg_008691 [Gypsophila vaccaria]
MSSDHTYRRRLSSYFPDYGAIFLANQSTREECLQRKLLGLPLAFSDFIFEVKIGMLLFLYDFHKRKLYGVFEASSNGGLELVPDAYKSTKMWFPAQVHFNVLWQCAPLEGNAFRDAIAENFYEKNKFNFGLSRDQVGRLLFLFERSKLKIQRSHMSDGCHQRNRKNVSSSRPQNLDAADIKWGSFSNNKEECMSVIEEKKDINSKNMKEVLRKLDGKHTIWQNCTNRPHQCHEGSDARRFKRKKSFKTGERKKMAGKRQKETETCNSSVDDRRYEAAYMTETSIVVAGDMGLTKELSMTDSGICEDVVNDSLETNYGDNPVLSLLVEFQQYLSRWRIEDQTEKASLGVDTNVDLRSCSVGARLNIT